MSLCLLQKPIFIFSLLVLIIFTRSAKSFMRVSVFPHAPVLILECKDLTHLLDLKLGNVLMSFEDESILKDFICRQQPMQCKVDGDNGRTIYRCHNDFGPLDASKITNMFPQIVDFGLATRLDKPSTHNGMVGEQLGIYPIQPDYYRAPEVILGCGWNFKADIWNFGVLVRLLKLFSGDECTMKKTFRFFPFG